MAYGHASSTITNSPSETRSSNKLYLFLKSPLLILLEQKTNNTLNYDVQADLEWSFFMPQSPNAGIKGMSQHTQL